MKSKLMAIIFSVLLATVIVSVISLTGKPSGLIALPFPCVVHYTLTAPQTYEIYPGGTGSVRVDISDVSCGISYVRLTLENFPHAYYNITPSLLAAVAPGEIESFWINFNIPEDVPLNTYVATFRVRTNVDLLEKGSMTIQIKSSDKPAEKLEPIEGAPIRIPVEGKGQKMWWVIGLTSAVLAVLILSHEFFPVAPRKRAKSGGKKGVEDVLAAYKKKQKR